MAHFRLKYATLSQRFSYAKLCDEVVISNLEATAFPQNDGRLENLLSHGKLPHDEQSFWLDIWTQNTNASKPVLFWIHGGAFVAGAGGDPQNDAEILSQQTDIVVVHVSYRLGMLGFSNGKTGEKNLGYHDILLALEWVHTHIREFGGDANNITIGGQSSGAWYAMAIHMSPRTQHLFKKTMLFSWPGTLKPFSTEQEQEVVNRFEKELYDICQIDMKTAPIDAMLQAQRIVGKQNQKKYSLTVPFVPIEEEGFIVADFESVLPTISKPLYVQYTVEECGVYVCQYPIYKHTPTWFVAPFLKKYCPHEAYQRLKNMRKKTNDTYQAVVNVTSEIVFHEPAQRISQLSDNQLVLHEFTFPVASRTRCCHCFDIPFIFGCFDAWKDAKIFENCDVDEMKKVSQKLQREIGEFIGLQ